MRKFSIVLANFAIVALGLTYGEVAMAIEEPTFEVIEKFDNIEIRQYRPIIVAEALVDGDMASASTKGFRLIADYIFGNNQSRQTSGDKPSEKISMTAPVTIEPVAQSEKITMTAPVTIVPQDDGKLMQGSHWRIHFVMPREYSMATLPQPRNPAVTIREIPAKRYAVLIFSGFAGEEKVQQKTNDLLAYLKARKHEGIAPPQLARYNPPWTLPLLRRNEILIEVATP
jgi:effector-binding domain-containing protein